MEHSAFLELNFYTNKYMNITKAEMLSDLREKVSIFEVPSFFYFSLFEFKQDPNKILSRIDNEFHSTIVIRSSSIFEDGISASSAGEFESILNINPKKQDDVKRSIQTVIESYKHKESDNNQIIIQEMLENTSMSGVIFTHDLNSGAPYFVINYDDESGSTDTVTSGSGEYSNRTLYIHRASQKKLKSERFIRLLDAVNELEVILKSEFLDIEFALDINLKPYLLQVRPITTKPNWNRSIAKKIDLSLVGVESFLKERFKSIENIYGDTTILGQMPDWNPVEMIGRSPRLLASSLYKEIITDSPWRVAREIMGYSTPVGQPLMIMLAEQPYIDTRLSFHSYLPKNLSPSISKKLVNHWVESLSKSPELHDKVEFDVAITAYCFDIDNKIEQLIGNALSLEEKDEFKKVHLEQTRSLIIGNSAGSIDMAMIKINKLNDIQNNQTSNDDISLIFEKLDNCIHLGTVPFSILARHGFIAQIILKSLKAKKILSNDEINDIQSSVQTVASELVKDMNDLQTGDIDNKVFMKKYGHLRPGTYDIMSSRYDQMGNLGSNTNNSAAVQNANQEISSFKLSKLQKDQINNLLNENDFQDFYADDLFKYINDATVGREYGKFIFTKTLSEILELIASFATKNNLSREEISHVPLNKILEILKTSNNKSIEDNLRKISIEGAGKNEVSIATRLPQLLIDDSGVFIVPFQVSHPNFITTKKITAPCVFLKSDIDELSLENKVVVIEGADPGFDWIFSQNIAGLVTKYGGANSHMAIRCAEFGIPAAIGCGEQRYDAIYSGSKVHLDCAAGLIMPMH